MPDQSFISEYIRLIILQYSDRPKALGEMTALVSNLSDVYTLYESFYPAFDLDDAIGAQLDIIGRIVGLGRSIPFVIPKRFFGFIDNPVSGGFSDKFDSFMLDVYPFADRFAPTLTDYQMDDDMYRRFIRIKIAKNIASAYMISSGFVGIQEAIQTSFSGAAYVVDNKDMTLTLYVNQQMADLMQYIFALDLLPRPEGVDYKYVIIAEVGNTFGFRDNMNSKGFGDRFDSSVIGGRMAIKTDISMEDI
jgi:hypothetical protein